MYGVYPFAAAYFGEAPPGEASIPTFHDEVAVECKRLDCPTTNDFSAYNLQDGSIREVPAVEVECKTLDCESSQDIPIYSLQDAIFFNGTPITVILTCPEGYVCPPNMPPTITYPPGTFTFPDPGPCNGFPIVLTMIGCISPVTRTLPCGASQAQINAAAQSIILAIAQQQAQCSVIDGNPPPNPIGFLNQLVSRHVNCPDGSSALFTGVVPSWAEYDSVNAIFYAKAGIFSGTSQNNANTNAINAILNFINNAFTAGTLECVSNCVIDNSSPLPNGSNGVAYSTTLTASVIAGTLTWSIIGGALPDGLTLNTSTGEISGTPTVDDNFSFEAQVSNGIISCHKNFDLFVSTAGAFPGFPYFFLSGNAEELTSATINGYNFITGQPPDGTPLGASIVTNWSVAGGTLGYTVAFECPSVAGPSDAGTYRVTIDNVSTQPFSGFNDNQVIVYLNGVSQYVYNTNTTTGPLFVDVVVASGDELKVLLAVEGVNAPAASYQVTITAVKL